MNSVELKRELRKTMRLRRDAEPGRLAKSQAIVDTLLALPSIEGAKVISCYVSFRSEVETRELIRCLLGQEKTVIVPWCEGDRLNLTRIVSMSELAPRTLGLLEPVQALREDTSRVVSPGKVDIFLVPGLAFTKSGDRLGYGRGHYDRLLAQSPNSLKIALAFEVQVVEAIPVDRLDIPVNSVVTENQVLS